MSNRLRQFIGYAYNEGSNLLNRALPPETRTEMKARVQNFAIDNPKLAAFLAAQIAFTGLPIVLFLAFTLTIFVSSLLTGLVLATIAATLFTLVLAGAALIILLPTVFFTTFAASFVWAWGLSAYFVLQMVTRRNKRTGSGQGGRHSIEDFVPKSLKRSVADNGTTGGRQEVKKPAYDESPHNGQRTPSFATFEHDPDVMAKDVDPEVKKMLDEMKEHGNPFGVLDATSAPPPS